MNLVDEYNKRYVFFVEITGVFSLDGIYSEWYERYSDGTIEKIRLI